MTTIRTPMADIQVNMNLAKPSSRKKSQESYLQTEAERQLRHDKLMKELEVRKHKLETEFFWA